MVPLGLSAADRRLFEAALARTHQRRITVDVQTLSGETLASITPVIVDGEIQAKPGWGVNRSASLSFLDPHHAMSFDTDSPDDGAMYADRMLYIRYGVYVEALERWVDVPVFRGPVTRLERSGGTVQVEAQDKAALARNAVWTPITLRKGMRTVSAIRTLMQRRSGERNFDLPNLKNRLAQTRTLSRMASVWNQTVDLAKSLDRQLFYDGRGVLRLRRLPKGSVFTFTDGDGGTVLTEPTVTYDLSEFHNMVEVTGGKPKGSKKRIVVVDHPNWGHPLHPVRVGRNGVRRHLPLRVSAPNVTSWRQAKRIANDKLNEAAMEALEVSFDALPVPHLDVGDMVQVRTDTYTVNFRLKEFTIPLAGAEMPIGYTRRVRLGRGQWKGRRR